MSADLANIRVLVTRPDPQGLQLSHMINRAGGKAIHFPTIAFTEPADISQFQQAIAVIGEQDWLIFVSPQAVYSSVPAIRRAWPELPPRVKFAAVGAGTARALQEAGYNVACFPKRGAGSEGLLALPAFHSCRNTKIAVIRGAGGRELIDKHLAEKGAHLLTVIAYQRIIPKLDVKPIEQLLKEDKIDVIIGTSFEALNNLKIVISESYWEKLKNIPLAVFSDRIKKLAYQLGFATIWVTQEMTDASILQLLCNKKEILAYDR